MASPSCKQCLKAAGSSMREDVGDAARKMTANGGGGHFECVFSGDRLFSQDHPYEICEDGLVYRVRGSTFNGICALAKGEDPELQFSEQADTLPPRVIDVVRWAGLRHAPLDKSSFIKHWQRYVAALQRRVEGDDPDAADQLLLRCHDFARKLLHGKSCSSNPSDANACAPFSHDALHPLPPNPRRIL